jgi:hypothetical protein
MPKGLLLLNIQTYVDGHLLVLDRDISSCSVWNCVQGYMRDMRTYLKASKSCKEWDGFFG